jgi:hypothetical protein
VADSTVNENTPSRYVVGFDLGTTNSAVTFVDTTEEPWQVRVFAVPQLVAAGQVEARETLPSFHYQPGAGELPSEALRLPWTSKSPGESPHVVGFFARDHGAEAPGRLISSAKSWLCHSGVDRTADLLPWQGAADVQRLSPVEVSARYLAHVRAAWDARFPRHPLAEQDFVLTLPASFDEVARELTVKAAASAGLPRVVLIEEPQAAFYAWIDAHRNQWEQLVQPGQKILVCDIGGGTSDFTLIRVRSGQGGKVQFHRVAVGDHLILGGDNLDLALAHYLEQRLMSKGQPSPESSAGGGGERLEPRQWAMLVQRSRQLKETLLGPAAPECLTLSLPWSGSRLIGGARQVEVPRSEVYNLLVEGFFPLVTLDARPSRRGSGFQEFGLPFAPDPAVTRYLAAFLTAHRNVAMDDVQLPPGQDPARPDIVLFNGGLFESPVLRQRMIDSLRHMFGGKWEPIVLANDRLDLAVARGAAYYGMVRRGLGVRIAAGLARTYYIGVEGKDEGGRMKDEGGGIKDEEEASRDDATDPLHPSSFILHPSALCLVPAGVEPGHDVNLSERRFDLIVSEPVEFPLYVSSTRLTDRPGELVPFDREQMTPLPPIRTVLRTRKKGETETVAVNLHARLTEIGTLDLWCGEIAGKRSWRLQFDVRSATQTDVSAHESAAEGEGFVDEATWQGCLNAIRQVFAAEPSGRSEYAGEKPDGLMKRLAGVAGMNRNAWPTSLCRRIWEALIENEAGRRKGPVHEARWLNLLGFALRPGYGLAVDDWRVAETWRLVQGKLVHPSAAVRMEGWIVWRRIGGGLMAGQQQALAEPLLGPIRGLHRLVVGGKGRGEFGFQPHETAEIWRLLGSLELLPVSLKIELGEILLDLLPKRKMETVRPAIVWALGRLGARAPLYGPLNTVVPAETAGPWLKRLIDSFGGDPAGALAVMQIARKTDDRYRDLTQKQRDAAAAYLRRENASSHFIALVERGGSLDREEQGLVFGESLPKGLRLS